MGRGRRRTGAQLDGWAQATPWIVLGVGLALALALAITVDTRRRGQREQRTVGETLQARARPTSEPGPVEPLSRAA
jgi:hypothetical protein